MSGGRGRDGGDEAAGGVVRAWLHSFIADPGFSQSYRYYAGVLGRLEPFADPRVRVMAVSARGPRFHLHINPDYFIEHPQFLRGILLHEVHHIVLGHLSHPKLRGVAHPDLMELAMEISANEHIEEPLPKGAIRWQRFQEVGVAAGQSTRERYARLVAARQGKPDSERRRRRLSEIMGLSDGTWVDDHDVENLHGASVVREIPAAPSPAQAIEDVTTLIDRASTYDPGPSEGARDSGHSSEPRGASRLAGREPADLVAELRATDEPPQAEVDWRTELRNLVAPLRAPTHTYARPNRRFPARVGEIPGRARRLAARDRPHLFVAIDTSASMGEAELTEIARQLRVLSLLARITIAECDVAIHRIYPFKGRLDEVVGRGGTDLRPVFDPDLQRTHRPDALVYFTDGYGPFPDQAPKVRTLWVLTGGDRNFDCGWGRRATLSGPKRSD